MSFILAASTQRTIGWVLAILVTAPVLFLLVRRAVAIVFRTDPEVGSEIELAPNRLPAVPDEYLEGRRLDRSLGAGLVTMAIIGVTLPLYWLGEPGRIEGADADYTRQFISRGSQQYEELCTACHGPGGTAGIASYTLTESGTFVSQVPWVAPALNTVLTRFSEEEVLHVLNFGRNGVMPAWGAPGGGPLTAQQLDNLILYLRSIQLDAGDIQASVRDGAEQRKAALFAAADDGLSSEDSEAMAAEFMTEIEAMLTPLAADAEELLSARIAGVDRLPAGDTRSNEKAKIASQIEELVSVALLQPDFAQSDLLISWGEVLFSNRADGGVYGCARCHTAGFGYAAVETAERTDETPVLDSYEHGGGAFGPSLLGAATETRFITESEHQDFVASGSQSGFDYGSAGRSSQGSGQMPGFGEREEDGSVYNALLTAPEIAAIVAYERSL
ncbi:MAG: cytochrome c [Acidimicrobiales bacterium]